MDDEGLRSLERRCDTDPAARFRFFLELDRRRLPLAGPLSAETAEAIQEFRRALYALLRGVNGRSTNARVEAVSVASAIASFDRAPAREGLHWTWIVGLPPYGRRNKRTVVLVVADATAVAIGARAWRPHTTPGVWVEIPEQPDGSRHLAVRDGSPPRHYAALIGRWGLRVPREVAERWAHRFDFDAEGNGDAWVRPAVSERIRCERAAAKGPRSVLRCALCHGDLDDPRTVCAGCRTLLHADCFEALGRCPTLGCHGVRAPWRRTRFVPPEPRELSLHGCLGAFLAAVAIVALIVGGGAFWFFFERPREWRTDLERQVRAVEPALLAYVVAIQSGAIKGAGDTDRAFYPVPVLPAGGPPIESVRSDRYGNVIFETEHSLNWDVGFEFRNGDAPIKGTGIGQVTVDHLFGPWWDFDDYGP